MQAYPKKTCELEKLITNEKLVRLAIEGEKTRQSRNGVYGYPGEEFTLGENKFVITDLFREKLGDMTDEEAKEEGFPNIEAYKKMIFGIHKNVVLNLLEKTSLNKNMKVWVHKFKKVS